MFFLTVVFSMLDIDLISEIPGNALDDLFALTPALAINGYFWQFITYMFMHAGFWHLFINMFTLVTFGPMVEMEMGSKRFLIFYLLCGLGSAILHIALTGISVVPMVGASGAIFGVLTAFGLMFPRQQVLFMFLFPMPAITAVAIFGFLEFFYGITSPGSGIAHFGHLGGIVTAIILLKVFKIWRKKEWYWFWEY